MRTIGSPLELERRRQLAVQRLHEGHPVEDIAQMLGVDSRTVRRWRAAFDNQGLRGLRAKPVSGRPPKLTRTQEKLIGRWLAESPIDFGFDTELWTGRRLAQLIEDEWEIEFHPRYLSVWLRAHQYTPQRPRRVPQERDEQKLHAWIAEDWPRILKPFAAGKRLSP